MKLAFTMDGFDQIGRELQIRAAYLEDRGAALISEYGGYAKELTSQLSPFDTGFMSEHVRTDIEPSGLAFETGWRIEDFEAQGLPPYYIFQEFGTVFMDAQPSLGPAWNELEPAFKRDAQDLMSDTMVRGK